MAAQVGKPRLQDGEKQESPLFFAVSPSFRRYFRELADHERLSAVELLRRSVQMYGKKKGMSYEGQ